MGQPSSTTSIDEEESSAELELDGATEELLGTLLLELPGTLLELPGSGGESMPATTFLISSRLGTLAEGAKFNMLALTSSIFKPAKPFAISALTDLLKAPLLLMSLDIASSKLETSPVALLPCNKMETMSNAESLGLLPKRDMSSLFWATLPLMPRALRTCLWVSFFATSNSVPLFASFKTLSCSKCVKTFMLTLLLPDTSATDFRVIWSVDGCPLTSLTYLPLTTIEM
ncbi:hypothetical protein R83H12_02342 [Fibrobacteria bacterium R8-3-H12]